MSASVVDAVIEEYTAAYAARDPDRIAACFSEDGVFEDVPFEQSYHGREEIKAFAKQLFAAYPDFALEYVHTYYAGDFVIREFVMNGTQFGEYQGTPATSKPMKCRSVVVIELKDGKIKRHTGYYDRVTILTQVEAMPPLEQLKEMLATH